MTLIDGWVKHPLLLELWTLIEHETSYRVVADTRQIVELAAQALDREEGASTDTRFVFKASLDIGAAGVVPVLNSIGRDDLIRSTGVSGIRSVLSALHARTGLTRATLRQILLRSNQLERFLGNWSSWENHVAEEINGAIAEVAVKGVRYAPVDSARPLDILGKLFRVDVKKSVPATKSIYNRVPWQSEIEQHFAEGLEARKDVLFYLKLPNAFTIDTIVGPHTPDWAIVMEKADGARAITIVETKGDSSKLQLRREEQIKIECARAHFKSLGVEYKVLTDITDL